VEESQRDSAISGETQSPTPPTSAFLLQTQAQLDASKTALAKTEQRFRQIFEAWDNYEKWQLECERRADGARLDVRTMIAQLCDSSFHELPLELAAHPSALSTAMHHQQQQHHAALKARNASALPSLPPPPSMHPAARVRTRAGSLDREREKGPKRSKSERYRVSEEVSFGLAYHLSAKAELNLTP